MTFYPSQKVVCIEDGVLTNDPASYWMPGEEIYKFEIYTIRRYHEHSGRPTVWLEEVRRSDVAVSVFGPDVGYGAMRFRPLVSQNIEIPAYGKIKEKVR